MTRFDTSVLQPNPARRRPILAVLDAALDAVDPYAAVQHVLQRRGDILTVADPSIRESENAPTYDLHRFRRIFVIGAGKAAAPMCRAVEDLLGDRISQGLAVTKYDHGLPSGQSAAAPSPIRIVEAGHPMPDKAGVRAGKEMLALAEQANQDDLLIALLSGGGSALLARRRLTLPAAPGIRAPVATRPHIQNSRWPTCKA